MHGDAAAFRAESDKKSGHNTEHNDARQFINKLALGGQNLLLDNVFDF